MTGIPGDPCPPPGYTDTWDCRSAGLATLVAVPDRCGKAGCAATDSLVQHHVRAPGMEQRWALCPTHDTDLPDLPRAPCTGECGTREDPA